MYKDCLWHCDIRMNRDIYYCCNQTMWIAVDVLHNKHNLCAWYTHTNRICSSFETHIEFKRDFRSGMQYFLLFFSFLFLFLCVFFLPLSVSFFHVFFLSLSCLFFLFFFSLLQPYALMGQRIVSTTEKARKFVFLSEGINFNDVPCNKRTQSSNDSKQLISRAAYIPFQTCRWYASQNVTLRLQHEGYWELTDLIYSNYSHFPEQAFVFNEWPRMQVCIQILPIIFSHSDARAHT